ncbi:hypothetical protein GPECTOR_6g900 [Gonium pectorale]|uniref:Uncharacterized protein n=1 Tax=Gonium pectorale TaxID=33097 RepID=A0A150GX88_GONPE|nr:hypothetical protein GPECTOR_6g900 [Gonium pectorale]|eukprot:KXZ53980.1 hypothetical protein GPECTOR_6g900 [Gonium pectorale]
MAGRVEPEPPAGACHEWLQPQQQPQLAHLAQAEPPGQSRPVPQQGSPAGAGVEGHGKELETAVLTPKRVLLAAVTGPMGASGAGGEVEAATTTRQRVLGNTADPGQDPGQEVDLDAVMASAEVDSEAAACLRAASELLDRYRRLLRLAAGPGGADASAAQRALARAAAAAGASWQLQNVVSTALCAALAAGEMPKGCDVTPTAALSLGLLLGPALGDFCPDTAPRLAEPRSHAASAAAAEATATPARAVAALLTPPPMR